MKTEIEVKFLNVDHDEIRQKLKDAGGKLVTPMRDMRRALFETPEMRERNGFYRLRDEGNKITLTYKEFDSWIGGAIDGAKEIEIEVSDFDATVALLAQNNLEPITYQESRREAWDLNGCEVVLDEWPWIPTYIEIEGESEQLVRDTAALLSFDWADAVFGNVDTIYDREYPNMTERGVIDVPEARFGDPVPKMFLGKGND